MYVVLCWRMNHTCFLLLVVAANNKDDRTTKVKYREKEKAPFFLLASPALRGKSRPSCHAASSFFLLSPSFALSSGLPFPQSPRGGDLSLKSPGLSHFRQFAGCLVRGRSDAAYGENSEKKWASCSDPLVIPRTVGCASVMKSLDSFMILDR